MKVVDRRSTVIDYRPRDHRLGLRIWKDRCQIIAPLGSEWTGVGPQLQLPLDVPQSVEDFLAAEGDSKAVSVAAFRYELVEPGSDLFEVLKKEKSFEKAIEAA
jgi:hypothetical protein